MKILSINDLKGSKSFRDANPQLFGVGPMEASQPKPVPVQALASSSPAQPRRKSRVVCCVILIACRRRLIDDDNNVASFKPLRDAIAKSLEIDDGDKCFRWQYGQIRTDGEQGVMVKIELK